MMNGRFHSPLQGQRRVGSAWGLYEGSWFEAYLSRRVDWLDRPSDPGLADAVPATVRFSKAELAQLRGEVA
jgi:hypothetical protein